MPEQDRHRTGRALFTLDRRMWKRLGRAVDNRAAVLRAFIAWYLREPGARLPQRPERLPADTEDP
jgi:hypothetical protein